MALDVEPANLDVINQWQRPMRDTEVMIKKKTTSKPIFPASVFTL